MKIELNEYEGFFEIVLAAETVADAAKLVRMAMNRTNELRSCVADADRNGTIGGFVLIGKRKKVVRTVGE